MQQGRKKKEEKNEEEEAKLHIEEEDKFVKSGEEKEDEENTKEEGLGSFKNFVKDLIHKKQEPITYDNELYFFKKISYNNVDGYIKIGNPVNDIYYIELSYNYSKIEAYVKKENLEYAIKNSIRLLASIQYNDIILDTLIGEKTLDYKEEAYSLFESKREDGNFLDYIEEYDVYDEENEKIKDEDLLDTSE